MIKMKRLLLFGLLFLVGLISVSAVSNLGTFEQGSSFQLVQICDSCSFVNLDSVTFPDGSVVSYNASMSKQSYTFNYSFSDSWQLGFYNYFVCGDKAGSLLCENIIFEVTVDGRDGNFSDSFKYFIFLAIGLILYGFGMAYKNYTPTILGGFTIFLLGVYIFIVPIAGVAAWVSYVIASVLFGWGGIIWVMASLEDYNT